MARLPSLIALPLLIVLGACSDENPQNTEAAGATPPNAAAAGNPQVAAAQVDATNAADTAADEACCAAESAEGAASAAAAEHAAGESCDGCVEGAAKPEEPVAGNEMGITLTEFTPISQLLESPADFEGKRVLVKGEAIEACAKRGCWVTLKSDEAFQSIQVKVNDGEIVFPQSCVGTELVVEGELEKLEPTLEQYRAMLKHKAEEQGEEFDAESVTEPGVIWRIRGLGAKFES